MMVRIYWDMSILKITFCMLQASISLVIPREYHRFILGKSGKRLQELELATATKVYLPRPDDKSANPNEVKIVGAKEGIDKARHEIEAIHEEQVIIWEGLLLLHNLIRHFPFFFFLFRSMC